MTFREARSIAEDAKVERNPWRSAAATPAAYFPLTPGFPLLGSSLGRLQPSPESPLLEADGSTNHQAVSQISQPPSARTPNTRAESGEVPSSFDAALREKGGREFPYQGMSPGRRGTTRGQLLRLFSCRWPRRAKTKPITPSNVVPEPRTATYLPSPPTTSGLLNTINHGLRGLVLSSVALGLLSTGRAVSATWTIYPDGTGDAPTIQAAIDSARVLDVVIVMPGTYYENIDFNGKDIVVRSAQGPEVTIIDGSRANDSVVLFHNAETRDAVLEGFTIQGGSGNTRLSSLKGGGVLCTNASPVIRGNHITRSSANDFVGGGSGGGMAIGTGLLTTPTPAPLLEDNIFSENTAGRTGGAIFVAHAEPILRGNIFRGNFSGYDGGAIFGVFNLGCMTIEHCQFWENTAGDLGGAILLTDNSHGLAGAMILRHNLFVRNKASGTGTGDSGSGGAMLLGHIHGEVSNNTLVSNRGDGESPCSGGGLLLSATPSALTVQGNLIAFNEDCGIACKNGVETVLGHNLLWQNTGSDLGTGTGQCPEAWRDVVLIGDPEFCGPVNDNYTVAKDSPALTGAEVMGAFSAPGCGPGVAVRVTTWGGIKSMYR